MSGVGLAGFVLALSVLALLAAALVAVRAARRRAAAEARLTAALGDHIAYQHHVERELQQAAAALHETTMELERSNRELEHFASVASHDLRAPLNKVRGFADLLVREYGPHLGEDGQDLLRRIDRSIARMETLVDDLLTLARVRAEGRPFTRVDLGAVLRDVIADLDGTLRETGGRVDAGELPAIDADPMQMHQLLQNLVGNGVKFRREGCPPHVRVSAAIREAGVAAAHDAAGRVGRICELRVTDNGIGFDGRHAERIFKPFERLHGPQRYEGSGIGLAVCARIAERHGGTIAATAVPGEGATFIVSLPMEHVKVAGVR